MLKCKYCGSRVTRSDRNCPNCGADISSVIEEEDKKIKDEFDKKTKHIAEEYNKVSNRMAIVFTTIGLFVIFVFLFVCFMIFKTSTGSKKSTSSGRETVSSELNEQAKDELFIVTCDKVESYNMIADFGGYTDSVMKDGYQQLAFHIVLSNISDKTLSFIYDDIDFVLLADGVQMKSSSVVDNYRFRHEEDGKKYESLPSSVAKDATVKGWIGFYVPFDTKELELKVGNVVIKMDNPAYKSE